MPNDIAKDLIRLAADMARATGLPSEFDDDHLPDRPRIYWLNCLSRTVDALRVYALRVRAGADEIESLRSRLTDAEREARVLVVAMADKCGAPDNWKPLPDAAGMITQISNMVAGLREERALLVTRAENAEAALEGADRLTNDAWKRLAEAEALRKDAERYRWLRIPENGVSVTIADEDDPETWYEYDSLRLDAAIDAAMEQSHDK
jgi:hypothetical protein